MHFDGASSTKGNGAIIILFSPPEKPYQYSFRFNFECTNNIVEFEALVIGLQEVVQLGYLYLQTFSDSELVVNMINGMYRPAKKVFRHYIGIINRSIKCFLYFSSLFSLSFSLLSSRISFFPSEFHD